MAGGHSHPDETNQTQQPLRQLPTNLLMGGLKNKLMADGQISNLTVTGKLTMPGSTSVLSVGAVPPTAANAGTGIWFDRTGFYALASNVEKFKVDAVTGLMTATGATISGALTATSGAIGGWTIDTTEIRNATSTVKLRSAGNLAFGATPPTASATGTGIFVDSTGIYSLLSNTYQVKIDAATGKLLGGAGAVVLDTNGLSILSSGSYSDATAYRLMNDVGTALLGGLYGYYADTDGPPAFHEHGIALKSLSLAGQVAYIDVTAIAPTGKLAQSGVNATSGATAVTISVTANDASDSYVNILGAAYTAMSADARIGGGIYIGATNVDPASGTITATSTITGTQLISNIATGTKPLDVTSTTVCTNLNADMCDGQHLGTGEGPTFNHLHLSALAAANDAVFYNLYSSTGADVTLGALNLVAISYPSATVGNRYCEINAGDSVNYRPLRLNPGGSWVCADSFHVGGTTDPGANNLLVDGTVSIGGKALSFGANDSAGAGYRTVKIENA